MHARLRLTRHVTAVTRQKTRTTTRRSRGHYRHIQTYHARPHAHNIYNATKSKSKNADSHERHPRSPQSRSPFPQPVSLLAPSIVQLLTPAPSVDLDLSAFSLHHSSRSLSISLSLLRSSLIVPRVTVSTSQRRIGIENSTSERERRRRSAKRPAAVILRPAPGPCSTIGESE